MTRNPSVAQLGGDQIPQLEVSSDPTWAPDGSHILFVHYEIVADEFHADLWTVRPDGSDRTVLARTPEIEDQPDWESCNPSPAAKAKFPSGWTGREPQL